MFPDLTRDDVFRIETRRLWLRWPRARDADAIQRLAGTPAVAGMTARIPYPLPRGAVESFLLRARSENAAGAGLTLALARRTDPTALIGIAGIGPGPDGAAEIGYWLGQPYWGAGLMREAVSALAHAYFAYAGGERLRADARVDNPAARRVLEACGFAWSGAQRRSLPARGGEWPVDLFVLDRDGRAARAEAA